MLLLLAAARAGAAPPQPPLDDALRQPFVALLRDAVRAGSRLEAAGFVVRLPHGGYAIVRWPDSETTDEARWDGAWPPGTVAIVHTHPNWMPLPSRVDRATAATGNVVVYVVTRGSITRTSGGAVETVVRGRWFAAQPPLQ